MKTAILDTWTESERGWGTRPDWCTIHLTEDDYKKYVKAYWDKMPDTVQDEYSIPDNRIRKVVLSDALFEKLEKSNGGICLWQSEFSKMETSNDILFKD